MHRSSMESSCPVVYRYMNLVVHSDGSFSRNPYQLPLRPASPSPVGHGPQVLTKDVTLNACHGTWARLFLPHLTETEEQEGKDMKGIQKIPILLYFHGGGFLSGSTAYPSDHDFLSKLALFARVLIFSVEYRLAPEHRLPAAYEDGIEALQWLCDQAGLGASADPWLAGRGDFSRLFVAGDSAGGNLAHHVVMRASQLGLGLQLGPGFDKGTEGVCMRGYVLINPSFSSEVATESEVRVLRSIEYSRKKWELSLPVGSNRDHPFAKPDFASFANPKTVLPPALVTVAGLDTLHDRGIAYYRTLQHAGHQAKLLVFENECHVFHLDFPDSENVLPLLKELSQFLNCN